MSKIWKLLKRFFQFVKKHKYSSFIVFAAALVSVFLLWESYAEFLSFKPPELKLQKKEEEIRVRAPLSGILVSQDLAKRRPIAVVIENHPDARPQSGLDKASLIFEALAEGGITRFLAVYQENDAEVGPVRSARTQFVYWAKELEAVFAHAGGSTASLSLINEIKVLDLNQFYNAASFWRDAKKFAPHNLYTTTEKLRSGGRKRGYSEEKEIESFKFKEDEKKDLRPESQSITINISGPSYKVGYSYNKDANNYKRFLAGAPHIDRITGNQLIAKNIIVQFTFVTEYAGSDAQVQAIGSGEIKYFRDGKAFDGRWEKKSANQRTKFFDLSGNEIELNAGTTWIEGVRKGTIVTVN